MIKQFNNELEELGPVEIEDYYYEYITPMSFDYYIENELILSNLYNPSKSLGNILRFWESMVEYEFY